MKANFLPAKKAEIKAKITFTSAGDYDDEIEHVAGVIFPVLTAEEYKQAKKLDKACADNYTKLQKLNKAPKIDQQALDKIRLLTEKAVQQRSDFVFAKIKGFTAKNDDGEFVPVELSEDEISGLKETTITTSKPFEMQVITKFYTEQRAAVVKN